LAHRARSEQLLISCADVSIAGTLSETRSSYSTFWRLSASAQRPALRLVWCAMLQTCVRHPGSFAGAKP